MGTRYTLVYDGQTATVEMTQDERAEEGIFFDSLGEVLVADGQGHYEDLVRKYGAA